MSKEIGIKLYSPDQYKNHEEASLVFEITNLTDKTLHILKWNTPLEGLISPCLDVKSGNKKVEYDGIMLKRGAPGPDDFYTLKPHDSVRAKIDLTQAYDISKPGEIKVNFNPDKFVYYTDEPLSKAVAASSKGFAPKAKGNAKMKLDIKSTSFTVSKGTHKRLTIGEVHRKEEQKKSVVLSKSAKAIAAKAKAAPALLPCQITGGTPAKQTIARNAHANGYALAKTALAGLVKNATYKLWFGAYSQTRLNRVKRHYRTVISRLQNVPFTYNLTGENCESNIYAYTYKGTSTIWLCTAFWNAPDTGTDSRAGTMLHEHTHASARTDDVQYGQDGCQQLARNNPARAVMNADSHEYYAGG